MLRRHRNVERTHYYIWSYEFIAKGATILYLL